MTEAATAGRSATGSPLRRVHIGAHATIDWDAIDTISETPRVRRFIAVDSAWHRLFELAHTPSYWELLVVAGADTWEHDKSKGRVSYIGDPLYMMLATSITGPGYSREWCTIT
ncbi:hypothetical protein Hanom_Chr10g00939011 [Helianthus anomalus]